MQELIPVNITIGDRSYRIRIEPSDEETVRRTVRLINEKLLEFKTNFAGKDMQDYIAMVLLWFVTEKQKPSNQWFSEQELSDKLASLEHLLDEALMK